MVIKNLEKNQACAYPMFLVSRWMRGHFSWQHLDCTNNG
jgi:hypothetical protein